LGGGLTIVCVLVCLCVCVSPVTTSSCPRSFLSFPEVFRVSRACLSLFPHAQSCLDLETKGLRQHTGLKGQSLYQSPMCIAFSKITLHKIGKKKTQRMVRYVGQYKEVSSVTESPRNPFLVRLYTHEGYTPFQIYTRSTTHP
jgi:hypothetical protein